MLARLLKSFGDTAKIEVEFRVVDKNTIELIIYQNKKRIKEKEKGGHIELNKILPLSEFTNKL